MGLQALRLVTDDEPVEWLGVRRELDRLTPGSDPYLIRMWREALAEALGRERAPHSDPLAFPYLPVSPERFGLRLSGASRVLDVGCLGGFGLFDLSLRRLRLGLPVPNLCGVDVDGESLGLGTALARRWSAPGRVAFQRATGEALPHASGSFDLVIARSVLQYLRIGPAIDELARVVRRGGLVLIQVHSPVYYLHQIARHLDQPLQAAYYGRALLSGVLFSSAGLQFRHRWFREAAITDRRLLTLCGSRRLRLLWSNHAVRRPLALFIKE